MNENSKNAITEERAVVESGTSLVELVDGALSDLHEEFQNENVVRLPIAQLETLGSGISSMIPSLRTVTTSTTVEGGGLYKLVNAGVGDSLKAAKDGTSWGAIRTADGGSKMAKFQEVGSLQNTTTTTLPVDPATMMMAAALFSIEQQLGRIEELEREILSFLEIEKESQIEADVKTLASILSNYKYNWDNKIFVSSNHKLVLDIQRAARSHMLSYQKRLNNKAKAKQLLVAQTTVNTSLTDMVKQFEYYRLSLFTYSMSSLIEIMLSGNREEAYIKDIRNDIEKCSQEYRDLFGKCSVHLEKLANASVEKNVLKGLGDTGKAIGKLIGKVPVVQKGPIDEFLQESGKKLKANAKKMAENPIHSFARLGDPGIRVFINKMEDLSQIYNHTKEIYFDDKQIYLIEEQ